MRVKFASIGYAATFCDLINEYKDQVWSETSKQLSHKQMSDVAKFRVPAKIVFIPYAERLRNLLHNPGIEIEDFRLLENCTVSRRSANVQLVVEGEGNVKRVAKEWIIMLRSSSPNVVSFVEHATES